MGRQPRRSKCAHVIFLAGVVMCCHAGETTIALKNNDTEVDCIKKRDRDFSNYCLEISHEGRPLSSRAFRCLLNQTLVYNCSSERTCMANGVMKDNVAPILAAEGCSGLPFANFHSDLQGSYECHLDNSRTSASFQLSYCTEPKKLLLKLTRDEQEVRCVVPGQREQDDYCLEVKQDDDTPASAFQCELNGNLVYTCRSSGDCEDSGKLSVHGTKPRNVSPSCEGIPFANMNHHLFGRYSCWMEMSVGRILAEFIVDLCSERLESPENVKPEEEDTTALYMIINYWYVWPILLFPIFVMLWCHSSRLRKLCCRPHDDGATNVKYHPTEATDVKYHPTEATDVKYHPTEATDVKYHRIEATDALYHPTEATDALYHPTEATDALYHPTEATDVKYHRTEATDVRYHRTEATDVKYHRTEATDALYHPTEAADPLYHPTEAADPLYHPTEAAEEDLK